VSARAPEIAAGDPLVSVGLPVYNGAKTIREALELILGQDYTNIELVISDNFSDDATSEICREYARKDARVRYTRTDELLPLYVNWQRVFELSRGEFFLWIAADDLRPRETIRRLVDALRSEALAVMAHGPIIVELLGSDEVIRVGNEFPSVGLDLAGRVRAYVRGIRHPGMMHGLLRRSALARLPLLTAPAQTRKGGPYGQDYLFNLRVVALGPVVWIADPILRYRDRIWKGSRFDDPIGTRTRWTQRGLFRAEEIERRKYRTLLRLGRRFVAETDGASEAERRRGARAYARAFVMAHAVPLLREVLLSLLWRLSGAGRRLADRHREPGRRSTAL
jgi:glycosyltransferase involved in cell wall biosynthesis